MEVDAPETIVLKINIFLRTEKDDMKIFFVTHHVITFHKRKDLVLLKRGKDN